MTLGNVAPPPQVGIPAGQVAKEDKKNRAVPGRFLSHSYRIYISVLEANYQFKTALSLCENLLTFLFQVSNSFVFS